MSRRVNVARAALLEVGREDLAKLIGEQMRALVARVR